MPKKDDYGDSSVSETGNWNVADKYTLTKIMRPLNLCDYYEDIARFGYESLSEELENYGSSLTDDVIKYRALTRLVRELIRLVQNTKFALKIGKTRETALGYMKDLTIINESLPNLIRKSNNHVAHTSNTKIVNHALFSRYVDNVSKIKSKLNEPLNQNHLIFTDKEEFDPRKHKENLKKRMVERG